MQLTIKILFPCIPCMLFVFSTIFGTLIAISPSSISNVFHLKAPSLESSERLKFGQSVCMSPDGNRIIIGANAYSKFKGTAYIYDLLEEPGIKMEHWRRTQLIGSGCEEAEEKKPGELRVLGRGSAFGFSCAMDASSQYIAIGAPGHNGQRGRVYFFSLSKKLGKWDEMTILEGPDSRSGDSYGWALAADSAGETLVVSAKGRRANSGEIYVYKCDKGFGLCKLSCRLVAPDYTDEAGPRGIRIRNNFGVSLALNHDGDTLAVGSTGFQGERGAVYVFSEQDSGGNYSFIQRLLSLNGQNAGFFGYKVAMDHSGCSIAVGADGEEEYRGAVYTFHRRNCPSRHSLYEDEREIVLRSSKPEDNFGGSVSISGDGRILLVGAPGANRGHLADHGTVHIYESTGEEWDYSEAIELGDDHSRSGTFFGWSTDSSYSSTRFVITAPNAYNELGMVLIAGYKTDGKRKADSRSIANDDVVSAVHDEL